MFKKDFIFKIHKRNIKVQYGDVEEGTDIFLDEAEPVTKSKKFHTKPGMRDYIKKGKKRFAKFKRYRQKLDVLLDYTIRPVLKYIIYPLYNYIISPCFKITIIPVYNFFKSIIKKLLDFIFSHWIFLFIKFKILRIYTFFRMQFIDFFNYILSFFSILNSFAIKYIPFWISICAGITFISERIGKLILGVYHLISLILYLFVYFVKHIFYWGFVLGENCNIISTKLWFMLISSKRALMHWVVLNQTLYAILIIFFVSYFVSNMDFFSQVVRDKFYFKNTRFLFIFFSPVIFFSIFRVLRFDLQFFVTNIYIYLHGWFCHEIYWLVIVPVLIGTIIWIFLFDFDVFGKKSSMQSEEKKFEDKLINPLYFLFVLIFRLAHIPVSIYNKYIYNMPRIWESLISCNYFCFKLTRRLVFSLFVLEARERLRNFEFQFEFIDVWPYYIIVSQLNPVAIHKTGILEFNPLYESDDPEFNLGREYTNEELSRMARFYYRNEIVYPKHIQYVGSVNDVNFFKNSLLSEIEELKKSTTRTFSSVYEKVKVKLYDYETKLILDFKDVILNETNFRKKQLILKNRELLSMNERRLLKQLEVKLKSVSELPNSVIMVSDIVRQLLNRRTVIIKYNDILLEDMEKVMKTINLKELEGFFEIKSLINKWEAEIQKIKFEVFKAAPMEDRVVNWDEKIFRKLDLELKSWMEERRKRIFQTNLYKSKNE